MHRSYWAVYNNDFIVEAQLHSNNVTEEIRNYTPVKVNNQVYADTKTETRTLSKIYSMTNKHNYLYNKRTEKSQWSKSTVCSRFIRGSYGAYRGPVL